MKIESVKLISFSPTGNSKKVGEAIAKGIQATIEYVDLTPSSARTQGFKEFHNELAVIAAPVYAGRIPNEGFGLYSTFLKTFIIDRRSIFWSRVADATTFSMLICSFFSDIFHTA